MVLLIPTLKLRTSCSPCLDSSSACRRSADLSSLDLRSSPSAGSKELPGVPLLPQLGELPTCCLANALRVAVSLSLALPCGLDSLDTDNGPTSILVGGVFHTSAFVCCPMDFATSVPCPVAGELLAEESKDCISIAAWVAFIAGNTSLARSSESPLWRVGIPFGAEAEKPNFPAPNSAWGLDTGGISLGDDLTNSSCFLSNWACASFFSLMTWNGCATIVLATLKWVYLTGYNNSTRRLQMRFKVKWWSSSKIMLTCSAHFWTSRKGLRKVPAAVAVLPASSCASPSATYAL